MFQFKFNEFIIKRELQQHHMYQVTTENDQQVGQIISSETEKLDTF